MTHIVSCMWYFVAKIQGSQGSWVSSFQSEGVSSDGEFYLIGIYFTVTTITTVGYGDISASTTGERIMCIILMLIGVVSYSYAIGSLSSLLTSLDSKTAKLKEKLSILDGIRSQFNLNFILYRKMKRAIHFDHNKDLTDKYTLINELPQRLQVELSIVVHQHMVQDLNFFIGKPGHFIAFVAPLLKPLMLQKGDYIFNKDDPIDAIYFLKKGIAGLVVKKIPADLVFIRIQPGANFGQYDFLKNEGLRSFTAKALTDVEMFLLDKKDLYRVDQQFKHITQKLFEKAMKNLKKAEIAQKKAEEWLKNKINKQQHNPAQLGILTKENHDPNLSFSANQVCELPTLQKKDHFGEVCILASTPNEPVSEPERTQTPNRQQGFNGLAKFLNSYLPPQDNQKQQNIQGLQQQNEELKSEVSEPKQANQAWVSDNEEREMTDSALIREQMQKSDSVHSLIQNQKRKFKDIPQSSFAVQNTQQEQSDLLSQSQEQYQQEKVRGRYQSKFLSKQSIIHKNQIIRERSFQLNPHTGRIETNMINILKSMSDKLNSMEIQMINMQRDIKQRKGGSRGNALTQTNLFGGTGGPSSTLIASPDPNRVISAGASNSKINGYSDGSKFERTDAKRAQNQGDQSKNNSLNRNIKTLIDVKGFDDIVDQAQISQRLPQSSRELQQINSKTLSENNRQESKLSNSQLGSKHSDKFRSSLQSQRLKIKKSKKNGGNILTKSGKRYEDINDFDENEKQQEDDEQRRMHDGVDHFKKSYNDEDDDIFKNWQS